MMDAAQQIEHLTRLLNVTRKMAATTDLTALLGTIVDATISVLDCDRATIFLYDPATNELYSSVATGGATIRFPADRGIAGAAAQDRAYVNVPDAYADPRFNQDIDKQTGFRTRNLLTFPLENNDNDLMGVLQALNKRGDAFGSTDEELARVLSAQAGVAIHRHLLLEQYAEKRRMERDLELARKIQQQLFPRENPNVAGYEIAGWNRSADETGGDCYDFVPLADGRQAILLADATGHGIGAALVIAQCRSLTRGMLSVTQDLAQVAQHVNRVLDQDLMDDRFVTAFLGVLDAENHRLEYVAPGQGPLIHIAADRVESRGANGLPYAVTEPLICDVESFDLAPGSTVALLTDGFYETTNPGDEQFGDERIIRFIHEHADLPLVALIERLHDEIRTFSAGAPQADDLTAVLIRRNL
jgi:sigma-B regulation protein RsbU (phosphoserine phosphatase)